MRCIGAILMFAALTLTSCGEPLGLPLDPRGTLERVRGGTMRVGVVENDVWARMTNGHAAGVEPALVRRLAEQLNSEVRWIKGPEHDLMEALERYQLDLVVGGLTHDSPWRGRVAMTFPYITSTLEVGAPPEAPAIDQIDGVNVAVPRGSARAAMVAEQGGVPVVVEQEKLAAYHGLVAAPRWQLLAWGRAPTGVKLHKNKHVWATPPGENAWLVAVERFLEEQRGEVETLLMTEAEARR